MSAEEDWDAWRERFDLTHNGIVRLFHDRAIWRSILSMLDSNPAVRRGGFGEYWLGSCYTNSQLIGIRRETDGDKDGVGLRRSLGQLAGCPRIATRDWYERELGKEHAGRSASDLAWLSSGFDRFAAPGAPFIDSERVKEDVADLEVVIIKVNEHSSKAIAHRDAAIARGQVAPIPVTWGQMDKALDRIGLVHAKYYRLCHPGESLGGLTPLVPPEWLMMFSTAWMTQNFVMPDHMDFEPEAYSAASDGQVSPLRPKRRPAGPGTRLAEAAQAHRTAGAGLTRGPRQPGSACTSSQDRAPRTSTWRVRSASSDASSFAAGGAFLTWAMFWDRVGQGLTWGFACQCVVLRPDSGHSAVRASRDWVTDGGGGNDHAGQGRAGARPRIGAVNGESGSSAAGSAVGEVRSADGTAIGYQRAGAGPAVVLLHGAGQSSANLMRLARALSGAFMVYVPDRRGRGRSGPYGQFHGLSTEIEDLSALLDACAASRVFGLSAGAVIAIEAALVRPDITKLALYEPPLTFDSVVHGDWAPQYQRQLTAGKPGAALVTVLKATADRTSVIRWIPRHPLEAALDFAIKRTADRPAPEGVMSPRELIPTLPYDAQTVNGAAGALERFAGLSCEILLLGGSRSARNLTASLDGLSRVLPDARRVVLHGTGHTAPDNSQKPDRVAAELHRFFSG